MDVNPNLDPGSVDGHTCFVAGQHPPCVIAPVSMNTGTYPQVVVQPQAPFAYVTPGGTGGSTSLVDLLQQGKQAFIAPAGSSSTSGAVRTAGITKIICTQSTPHQINPALGGTVIISGLVPADLNGTFQVIPGSVTDPWTFSYSQPGLPDETETNSPPNTPLGQVQYGTPYYTFNTTAFASAAAINPTTRTFATADYNASSNQIQFIGTLDQNLTSLSLSAGSCNGCIPNPSGAPEIGFHSVAWDPYTNVLLAYDPDDHFGSTYPTNAISLINPGGPGANGGNQAPYRIVKAISVGQIGQGAYTAAGQTAATIVNGPMTYDPKTRWALVANAGSNTLSYLDIDASNVFKRVAIQDLQLAAVSAGVPTQGVPNALPPQGAPAAQCDPTNTDGTKPCMAQAIQLNKTTTVRVIGQGFGTSAGAVVRLDAKPSALCAGPTDTSFCTTWVSDSEVDVTIPATMVTVAHDYALDVQVASVNSNAMDLHAVGLLDMSAVCTLPTDLTKNPQGPEGVAIDDLKHIAYVTNYSCNSVSSIAMDPAGYRKADNTLVPFGSVINTVTVGPNPIGIAVIPRLNYAVVSNNGDTPTGSASIIDISAPEAMKIVSWTTTRDASDDGDDGPGGIGSARSSHRSRPRPGADCQQRVQYIDCHRFDSAATRSSNHKNSNADNNCAERSADGDRHQSEQCDRGGDAAAKFRYDNGNRRHGCDQPGVESADSQLQRVG